MNQSSLAAPPNAPEPWNFSSTDTHFSGQFLLQKLRLLSQWLNVHGALISALFGVAGIVLVGATWLEFQTTINRVQTPIAATSSATTAQNPSTITIPVSPSSVSAKLRAHIAGAVRKPGVYELASPSVVQDLVTLAGGLSGLVWQDYLDEYINLAAPLQPNQKVWIPSLAQRELLVPAKESISLTSHAITSTIAIATESGRLSINTATVAELDTLAGIGQKRAEDIVANRPYVSFDELTSKAGVPASIVIQLKNQLKI